MIGTRHPESSPTESTHHRVTETGFRLSAGRLPRIGRTRQALAIGYSTCQSADTNLYHSEALSTTETGWLHERISLCHILLHSRTQAIREGVA